jgi:hypothetical protein
MNKNMKISTLAGCTFSEHDARIKNGLPCKVPHQFKKIHMLSLVSNVPVQIGFSQPAIVVHGYRSELLANLLAYLAIVSVAIWVSVVVTIVVRAGAHRRYRSVRRLQAEVKKRQAYRS